ncbi:MAG: hypothetical protein IKS03_06245 [Ruminococcus sp.]|nr:hypothetical protein [Ruminococcus sp.]
MPEICIFTGEDEKWREQQIISWKENFCRNSFYLQEKNGCPIKIKCENISAENIKKYFENLDSSEWSVCICIDKTKNFSLIKDIIINKWENKPDRYLCLLATDSYDESERTEEWRKKGIYLCNSFYAGKQESLETQIYRFLSELHTNRRKAWEKYESLSRPVSSYYEL